MTRVSCLRATIELRYGKGREVTPPQLFGPDPFAHPAPGPWVPMGGAAEQVIPSFRPYWGDQKYLALRRDSSNPLLEV